MFPTKILLATDGSEEAGHAARMAVALSEKTGSELHAVYVEPLPHPYALSEATIYYPEMRDEVRQTANQEAREKLRPGGRAWTPPERAPIPDTRRP